MDHAVHVARFVCRHHVADDTGRRRAMAAQRRLLEGELEAALAPLLRGDEVILLRRLDLQLRLDSQGSEGADASVWAQALAQQLLRELQHGGSDRLLRFAHRQQALQAFVEDLIDGRNSRDWAWQRLGLLQAASGPARRHDALLRLLADDSVHGVPLLRAMLATPRWPHLLQALADGELRGLALSVAWRLGGAGAAAWQADSTAALLAAVLSDGKGTAPRSTASAADNSTESAAADASSNRTVRPAAAQAAAAAAQARPAWWQPTLAAAASAGGARAVWALRLAAMLDGPALARRGAQALDQLLQAWAAADTENALGEVSAAPAPPAPRTGAGGGKSPSTRSPSKPAAPARGDTAAAADATQAQEPGAFITEHGGLLLLLPQLLPSGALARLEDAAVWPAQSLPQALHALALMLGPLAARDPAALAFCGLHPQADAPPPLQPNPAQQEAQQQALQQARQDLLQHLALCLPEWPASQRLARLRERRARIEADPGWIEVHFALSDVSLDLRRAALDLDPGFIPWLGVVMRYVYE